MRTLLIGTITSLLFVLSSWGDTCDGAQNRISNCGFETGTLSSWQLSGPQSSPSFEGITYGVDQADAYSGTYGAYLGGFGAALSLAQSFTTTPGTTYQISYVLAQAPNVPAPYAASFTTSFNGATLYSSSNPQSFAFTPFQFMVTAASATSTILFSARDDTGFYSLDDVSVTPAATTTVPEPSAFSLVVVSGCLMLVGTARKHFHSTQSMFLPKLTQRHQG